MNASQVGMLIVAGAAGVAAGLAIRAAIERSREQAAAVELPAALTLTPEPARIDAARAGLAVDESTGVPRSIPRLSAERALAGLRWSPLRRRVVRPAAAVLLAVLRLLVESARAAVAVPLVELDAAAVPAVIALPAAAIAPRIDRRSALRRRVLPVRGPDRPVSDWSFPGVAVLM
jgi:hypothetical protein